MNVSEAVSAWLFKLKSSTDLKICCSIGTTEVAATKADKVENGVMDAIEVVSELVIGMIADKVVVGAVLAVDLETTTEVVKVVEVPCKELCAVGTVLCLPKHFRFAPG